MPGDAVPSLALNHLDMGAAQSQVKAYLPLERPPIVKKDLQRAPHGNPADDGQAFARDAIAGTGAKIADKISREQAERDEDHADGHAHAALLQEVPQGAACLLGFVGEVIVNRFGQHRGPVAVLRPQLEVDGEMKAAAGRMTRRPGFDERVCLRVEVLGQERRRVQRVEQLRYLAHAQREAMNGCGTGCLCHAGIIPSTPSKSYAANSDQTLSEIRFVAVQKVFLPLALDIAWVYLPQPR